VVKERMRSSKVEGDF
jgi:hypothetical protein